MFCKYCGKKIDDDSVYCMFCGKRVKGHKVLVGIIQSQNK